MPWACRDTPSSFLALLASLTLGFEGGSTQLHHKGLLAELAVNSPSPSSPVEDPSSVNVGSAEALPTYYAGSEWGIQEDVSLSLEMCCIPALSLDPPSMCPGLHSLPLSLQGAQAGDPSHG